VLRVKNKALNGYLGIKRNRALNPTKCY